MIMWRAIARETIGFLQIGHFSFSDLFIFLLFTRATAVVGSAAIRRGAIAVFLFLFYFIFF
jgi:hypothetical protein